MAEEPAFGGIWSRGETSGQHHVFRGQGSDSVTETLVGAPGCPQATASNLFIKDTPEVAGVPGVCRRLCRCPSCGNPGSSLLPREAVASPEDSTGLTVGLPGVAPWPHLHQWCVCNSGVAKLLNLSELLLPIWTKGTTLLLSKGCQPQTGTCRGHRPSTL